MESAMADRITGKDAQALAATASAQFAKAHWSPASHPTLSALRIGRMPGAVELSPADGERIVIVVEANAEATIIERGSAGGFSVDLLLLENARVRYISSTAGSITARRFAQLGRDASIEWTDYAQGEHVQSTVTTVLAGEGADAQFRSVIMGTRSERYAVKTSMIHTASRSTSNMLTRAVMLDRSSGAYEGLIRIEPEAAGCDAYQKAETLLLGSEARMHATPNLEICNEDVRCSHGVSLGQIEGEKLFYLLSRGIGREPALRLIVEGFFAGIIDRMGEIGAKEEIRRRLEG